MALNTLPNEGLTNRGYPSDRITTPIIINGDMSVAQRATSATGKTGDGYYTIDRYQFAISSLGTWTFTQSTTVPSGQGFSYSQKADCTTADASPSAGDRIFYRQSFEGNTVQALKKGTSNAEKFTVSFWVRSNKTGTYILELYDHDNSRHINKSYSISSADTWEKKIIVIDADTTGAFTNDNNLSLHVAWWLGAGSTYTSGSLQTSWGSQTNANRAVGQVNLADSTSNEWYITGVQLEVGEFDSTSIPSFPFESFDNNFQRCERYFQFIQGFQGQMAATTNFTAVTTFRTPMRSAPSATVFGTGVLVITDNTSDFSQSSASGAILAGRVTTYGVQCYYPNFSGLTIFRPAHQNVNVNDFKMGMDAEL